MFRLNPLTIDFVIFLYFVPSIIVVVRFLLYLVKGEDRFYRWLRALTDLSLIFVAPLFLLYVSSTDQPDCCNTDGLNPFATDHVLTIGVWWAIGAATYIYVQWRKRIGSPVVEVAAAWILLFSLGLNVMIVWQAQDFTWFFGVPIIMLLLMALTNQHKQLTPRLRTLTDSGMLDSVAMEQPLIPDPEPLRGGPWQARLRPVLDWPVYSKYPFLLVLGIPLFVVVDSVLLLFGQRADSLLLAFTQTYHFHFSELDYLCEGVQCGGHYLCSVAAGGHAAMVRPVRYGIRGGRKIICNRQLLVANAFEEVLQERFPLAHRFIRRHYDRVGDFIHKDYTPYENKYLCDLIYLLMKPADWIFRLVLYTVDRDPEGRIARQYTSSL